MGRLFRWILIIVRLDLGIRLVRESGESVYLDFIFIIIPLIGFIFGERFVTSLCFLSRRRFGICGLDLEFVQFNRNVLMGSLSCGVLIVAWLDLGIRLLIRPVLGFICRRRTIFFFLLVFV